MTTPAAHPYAAGPARGAGAPLMTGDHGMGGAVTCLVLRRGDYVTDGLAAVLFDMDGLLVDTEPLWLETETEVMARLGARWTKADQEYLLGGSMERTVSYVLAKATKPAAPEEIAHWMIEGMLKRAAEGRVVVQAGARELLQEVAAAGIPYALVTSSQREFAEAVLQGAGFQFPVTVTAAEVARTKPDPEPYLLAAKLLDAAPENCAQRKANAAFHLGRDDVWVDGSAAIDRAGHTLHFDLPRILDADFDHLGDKGLECFRHGNAATAALRQRFGPSCLLRRQLQDRLHTRLLVEQVAAKLEGVLAGCMSHFVNKGFNGQGGM